MIDRFTKERFEKALPCLKGTKQPLWLSEGIRSGEYGYLIPVKPGVVILVRSTIDSTGVAANSGEDSIRCWLADSGGVSLGSKDVRWISRVNGWDRRMTETLRKLWRVGHRLEACPTCGKMMGAFKAKTGHNVGKWFMKCMPCDRFARWLEDVDEHRVKVHAGAGSGSSSSAQNRGAEIV